LGVFSNEKGIALVTVLVLSAISLAIMAGLIYMLVSGTQVSGIQKRYKTALESGIAGADIVEQFISKREDNPTTLETQTFNFLSGIDVTATQTCINNKLLSSTSSWNPACNNTMTINRGDATTYDMRFDLGLAPTTYRVFAKIVDTVEGNSGGDEGLLKTGVVQANTGEVSVTHIPYLYTVEIDAEDATNPAERAKLSVLYQY